MNDNILEGLGSACGDSVIGANEFRGDLTITVKKADIVKVCEVMKSTLGFDMIVDLCGVDMYTPQERFEVIYNLYSLERKQYIRLKVKVEEDHPVVPTVTGVWAGANWHERETFDMYGIRFDGHPDLRRMYMPEEFEYHPLRKDFPLMGIPDSIPLPRK